ncbi:MAG: KpsF/GutQ family sugar-phosphate isomerase [SAR324 cluster bacterium]|uniref:KpsF/GutQ family sugar-phosphate isomerase n=1 Tax=SAR324 cluster bacterium TaxID=2024889 RepID=A0A7X9IK54_9DELT|nr:KpsF/GutQ family sugar-phosphate isomerase [SAR324 cluster bacterium]
MIASEGDAIRELASCIDENFSRAVQMLLNMPQGSHVVVSGMGKAGIIGMKISATLASTGVSSFFLHPAEAIHGDLGRFSPNDIALILSNSGETKEILDILPAIKRFLCPIISITSNPDSALAKYSDVVLRVLREKEAGPFGFAPTTSTAMMLVLGDALCMALTKERGLSPEEFAVYHPGGDIGRALMSCGELMRRDDEHCVVIENTLAREVLHAITSTKGRPGAASVVDAEGVLKGIFTDGDLRRCLEKELDFLNKPISQVMGKTPKTIAPDRLAQEALAILNKFKIDQIIVIDEQKHPIGMIDIQDLVDFKLPAK